MNILDELWYGNLTPMEYTHIETNPEYKATLALFDRNLENLKATLNDEQIELLEKLLTANEELSNITELDCFKAGFKLGTKLTTEAYR